MVKLSVIIVNYNVRHFLEQCLISVKKASEGLPVETIVVDNQSTDGSLELIHEKFPDITLIANKKNVGFSKANNQGIKASQATYVLLLNPDTVVSEDTFSQVIQFMDSHPDAGGLGVKMIDGKGQFLPESKRGLPIPKVAFYKIFGLSALFPRSKTFGRYHLGYLDNDKTHEIDVLSGAFMLMRRETLEKTGYLDEDYFMYGEDIDLSYRIKKAGYKNYYFPDTKIIHYKGESTKKSSINYVLVFYRAMLIFATKHFSPKNARTFHLLIEFAIYARAFLAIINRVITKTLFPFLDFILAISGMYLMKEFYTEYSGIVYSETLVINGFIAYAITWMTAIWLSGGYDFPIKLPNVIRGVFIGSVTIFIIYALLPEGLRFSRALLLMGTAWMIFQAVLTRYLVHFSNIEKFRLHFSEPLRIGIVGSEEEEERIQRILNDTHVDVGYYAEISPTPYVQPDHTIHIAAVDKLPDILEVMHLNEIIFCSKDISYQEAMNWMIKCRKSPVNFKLAPTNTTSIIGSNSIHSTGELYSPELNRISTPANRRLKRLVDLVTCCMLLILSPVLLIFTPNPVGFSRNWIQVLSGRKTWVSYFPDKQHVGLPKIKPGVLVPVQDQPHTIIPENNYRSFNMNYVRSYSPLLDFTIIINGWRFLGKTRYQDNI